MSATLTLCETCHGLGLLDRFGMNRGGNARRCPDCNAIGAHNVATGPSDFAPGSREKVAILCSRYDAGIPLWNDFDITLENANSACTPEESPSSDGISKGGEDLI